MFYWQSPHVSIEPAYGLVRWRVYETDTGTAHFVGYDPKASRGRVSSAIQTFDLATRTCVTRSGRTYHLAGDTGMDPDAHYVFAEWCARNNVARARDVSDDVLAGTYFAAKH